MKPIFTAKYTFDNLIYPVISSVREWQSTPCVCYCQPVSWLYSSAVMGIFARQPGTSFNAALRSSPDYLGHYKKLPIDW